MLWRLLLALVPTKHLQLALGGRQGVEVHWVAADETTTLRCHGPCIMTVNWD